MEEFAKNHPADLSPDLQPDGSSSVESANSHIQKAMWAGKDSFFWVHKRTDGATFPADVLGPPMHIKNRDVLQATVRDITERKKSEEERNVLLRNLGERVKELNCIFRIQRFLRIQKS